MNSFSERLKDTVKRSGMTQRSIADRIGITEVSFSRYVNGGRTPKVTLIASIAETLGVTVEYLVNGTMPEDLRPCPFCNASGDDIEARIAYPTEFTKPILYVICRKCGGAVIDTNNEHSLLDVKMAWNRRKT